MRNFEDRWKVIFGEIVVNGDNKYICVAGYVHNNDDINKFSSGLYVRIYRDNQSFVGGSWVSKLQRYWAKGIGLTDKDCQLCCQAAQRLEKMKVFV
jgi:hypothetical protein